MENLRKQNFRSLLAILILVISGSVQAQSQVITGKVSDELGNDLPGVNILVKGTNIGSTTDANGSFTLEVKDPSGTLIASFIGYLTQEVPLSNRTRVSITLQPDVQQLSEVVVVGYGTQEKKDLTGSVSSVNAQDIQKVQVSGVDQALQGQIAGVQISTTSGAPGGNVNVLIRGVSSITGGVQPLFVIDGFPVNSVGIGNPMNTINPNDIESIDVLKDASATAIYGSRGSNGVIIITTKRGKSGKPTIQFNAYEGVQDVAKKIEMMNAQEFSSFVIDARNAGYLDNNPNGDINHDNAARPGGNYDIPVNLTNADLKTTDWQDAIFRTAPIRNYQLGASGGTDALRYNLSAGYFDQEGVIINSGLERYNVSLNLDGELSKKLDFGVSILPSYTALKEIPSTGHYGALGIISAAVGIDPSFPIYNDDGTYASTLPPVEAATGVPNPVKIANELKTQSSQFRFLSNAYLEYEIIEDLKLRTSFGVDLNYYKASVWNPSTLNSGANTGPASATATNTDNTNWLSETTLSYRKNSGEHTLDFVGGFTAQRNAFNQVQVTAGNFSDDLIPNIAGGIINGGYQNMSRTALISLLGRINYSFREKYLVTATIRSDGSSRFGNESRWGTFPSASLGWRVSEEDFLKSVSFISDIKIRLSYGITGNNAIGDYRAISLLSNANYVIGDAVTPGLSPGTLANSNLKWETQTQLNVGMDLSVIKGRVSLTADLYDKRNKDMLFNIQTPSATGFTNAFVNVGEVQNKGLELSLTTRNLVGEFQWNTNFNITFNRNKVLSMNEEGARIFGNTGGRGNTNLTQVGGPIGVFFGRRALGVFNTDAEAAEYGVQPNARAGDIKFKNVIGDDVINDLDREIIGNPHPDFYFGFNNTFSYKNFTLDIMTSGMYGNEIYSALFAINNSGVQNNLKFIDEARWRSPEEPGNSKYGQFGRAIRGGKNGNTNFSSLYIFDASYWRIRNITLGYNLPSGIVNKLRMTQARVYASVTNLHTFTNYFGYDPEVGNAGANQGSQTVLGVDFGTYPLSRVTSLGVNITF